MYRGRTWTMRQYAGYASARETNERFHYLIEHGSTGLSMAFDLPTQLGRDSDDPLCIGEVGRTGVAIDTIDDMRRVFDGIPLDQVSTSMTMNAPAAVLLLLYELVGEEQGVEADKLTGTTQNDVLKEYIARGNFIYPPGPRDAPHDGPLRLLPRAHPEVEHDLDLRLPHAREGLLGGAGGGLYARQRDRVRPGRHRCRPRGGRVRPAAGLLLQRPQQRLPGGRQVPRARRMWARIMRERFGATDERSLKMRFHTQTGGVTLAAQQPHNNIVRVALQGFAAVARRHAVAAHERVRRGARAAERDGRADRAPNAADPRPRVRRRDTADPFAGSYFVEALTDEIEDAAQALIDRVEEMGGSVNCIPFIRAEVEESAWGYEERYRQKQDIVVGVNEYVTEQVDEVEILRVDPIPSVSRWSG